MTYYFQLNPENLQTRFHQVAREINGDEAAKEDDCRQEKTEKNNGGSGIPDENRIPKHFNEQPEGCKASQGAFQTPLGVRNGNIGGAGAPEAFQKHTLSKGEVTTEVGKSMPTVDSLLDNVVANFDPFTTAHQIFTQK